ASDVRSAREAPARCWTFSSPSAEMSVGSVIRMIHNFRVRRHAGRADEQSQFIRRAANVSGADGQDCVTGTSGGEQRVNSLLQRTAINNLRVAGGADGGGERVA